jgi:CrcB protein
MTNSMADDWVWTIALVAAGSAVGGMARFLVSRLVGRTFGEVLPWGTMVVNVSGAFTIGVLFSLAEGNWLFVRPEAWLLAVTGFLGSYTTVSSFSLQTLALAQTGNRRGAVANIVLSIGLCLGAAAAGMLLVSTLNAVAAG